MPQKHEKSFSSQPLFVKLELCRLCTSMPNPICVTGNAIHESHCNPTINARRRKQRCAEPELYPFFLSFGAMLCAGICDQRWKWLQSFVISSSKHEMCSHVFHLSSLYHFRAQSQWLKGDGMQEVKITLFNANSGDESWSLVLVKWYQYLAGLDVQDWSHSISLWECNKILSLVNYVTAYLLMVKLMCIRVHTW